MRQNCSLVLSNGNHFKGKLIGAPLEASGELVFTTGMVGYSEAITDPSYFGQILTFTYPLIGNYGIPKLPKDIGYAIPTGFESSRPQAAAVILTVDSLETFHWNSFQSIDRWLQEQNVPGIVGLDTRHLVHLIRSQENLLGRVLPEESKGKRYSEESAGLTDESEFYDPGVHNIIDKVSTKSKMLLGEGNVRIAVVDCGVKWNIVRQLLDLDCEIELLPWDTDLETIDCDGWLISNGPGDPMRVEHLKEQIEKIFQQNKPILGICLGHQLMSLAAGANTKRMSYGHRSHNQPVYQVGTRIGHITTQNHGYVVEDNSIGESWVPWFRNANDQTIEGLRHKNKPFRSVQFHPEASGGPRDTAWIIKQFVEEVKE